MTKIIYDTNNNLDLIDCYYFKNDKYYFSARFNTCFVDYACISIDFTAGEKFTISPDLETLNDLPSEFVMNKSEIIGTCIAIADSVLCRTKGFDGYTYKTTTEGSSNKYDRLLELQELFLQWTPENYKCSSFSSVFRDYEFDSSNHS